MKIAVFFVGNVKDAGFNASALAGAEAAAEEGVADISIITDVQYDQDEILGRISDIIVDVDGLVFIGGQGNIATPVISKQYPEKLFAVVQGHLSGPNLAAYDVMQEHSAFLAGVLAATLTQTGIVGHLSGHRVAPGIKGRAAFAAGVNHAAPSVKLLTGFCGTQDDCDIARAWASAQIAAGVDILFTMLNGARTGAISACRDGGVRQIGNVLDWVSVDPDVFVASAIARIDLAVKRAIADMVAKITPQQVIQFGPDDGDFVSLSMGDEVSAPLVQSIHEISQNISNGLILVPRHYDGPEFQFEAMPCDTNS